MPRAASGPKFEKKCMICGKRITAKKDKYICPRGVCWDVGLSLYLNLKSYLGTVPKHIMVKDLKKVGDGFWSFSGQVLTSTKKVPFEGRTFRVN